MSAYAFVLSKNFSVEIEDENSLDEEKYNDKFRFLVNEITREHYISEELYDKIRNNNFNDNDVEVFNKFDSEFQELVKELKIKASVFPVNNESVRRIHVPVEFVDSSNKLNFEEFKKWRNNENLLQNYSCPKNYIVSREVEKMSKSKYNVVSPDDICEEYGADTLRLYEMFLGPLEQSKPWNTAGITGVSGFLKKLWRLYFDDNGSVIVNDEPTADMYKSLHKTIKKVTEDIENFSFNTSVSRFMICVNELQQLKCNNRAILEPLAILVSPYAPHIAEELWSALGHEGSIATVAFPKFEEKYLVESEKEYPVSFNGKMRFTIKLPLDLTKEQIQEIVLADERTIAQLAGNTPKNIIIVPGKIINLVG